MIQCDESAQALVLTPLESALYQRAGVEVAVLRLDQLHPQISGNKWFKLQRLRQRLQRGERPRLLSFGGAWSNHLHALAYLGHQYGVETLGVVRAHPAQALTAMLADAQAWGMRLHFVDRDTYRYGHRYGHRNAPRNGHPSTQSMDLLSQLQQQYGDFELIPEGGSSSDAVQGCREIWNRLPSGGWRTPDWLVLAVGTGATLAGLLAGKPNATRVLGVPVIRSDERLPQAIQALLRVAGEDDPGDWWLDTEAHGGGYGRVTPELAALMLTFEGRFEVPLEPVYTLKALAALNRQILRRKIAPGCRVLLVHTGGLQGRRGLEQSVRRKSALFTGPLAL